jgi:hypothetical protein
MALEAHVEELSGKHRALRRLPVAGQSFRKIPQIDVTAGLAHTAPGRSHLYQCIGPKSVHTFRVNLMHKQKIRAQLRVQRSVRRSSEA